MTKDYPLSPKYTRADVDRADELYDEHPLQEVAEITGIPEGTLYQWNRNGYIGTETNHRREHSDETIRRADVLYDHMPLSDVADVLDEVTYWCIKRWVEKGVISTDTNHNHHNGCEERNRRRARRAAHLVYEEDRSQKEVAEIMGVVQSSVSRYLKMYRTGTFVAPERA